MNVNIVIPNTLDILKLRGTTETFIKEYISLHNSNQIVSFCEHIKLLYYNQMDVERHQQVFTSIRIAEEKIHDNVKDRHRCILKYYGGDAAVTKGYAVLIAQLLTPLIGFQDKVDFAGSCDGCH